MHKFKEFPWTRPERHRCANESPPMESTLSQQNPVVSFRAEDKSWYPNICHIRLSPLTSFFEIFWTKICTHLSFSLALTISRLLPPSATIALIMEATRTAETSANFYQTTGRNSPEDGHIQVCKLDNHPRTENCNKKYRIHIDTSAKTSECIWTLSRSVG